MARQLVDKYEHKTEQQTQWRETFRDATQSTEVNLGGSGRALTEHHIKPLSRSTTPAPYSIVVWIPAEMTRVLLVSDSILANHSSHHPAAVKVHLC